MSLVTCIVTTCDRPTLVGRAVASVLSQTHAELELLVVVDGRDAATEETLAAFPDPRLRVIVRPTRGGQGAALNTGVAAARGDLTALLDDDDAWLPTKLARQLDAVKAADARTPIVGCRFVARREAGDVVWPTRGPRPNETIAEYLFCRHRLRFGEGIVPTSTIAAPTPLLRVVPLAENLRRHCDLDWLVRADQRADVRLVLPLDAEPIAVWEAQLDRDRMSNAHDWRDSLAWIHARRSLVGPRAYAGFVLTWVSHSARCQGDRRAFATLLRAAFRNGRPNAVELLVHAATWASPLGARRAAAATTIARPTP